MRTYHAPRLLEYSNQLILKLFLKFRIGIPTVCDHVRFQIAHILTATLLISYHTGITTNTASRHVLRQINIPHWGKKRV